MVLGLTYLLKRNYSSRFFVLLIMLFVVASASAEGNVNSIEQLNEEIDTFIKSADTPGAVVVVVENGELAMSKGYGWAEVDTKREMTPDTILRAGSLSKNITSLAALRLVSTGRLDLNARLSELLPDFKIHNPWENTNPIRLVNLLEHTAGIEGSTYYEYGFSEPGVAPQEYAELMSGRIEVRWPPGWYFSYANAGHTLVALIIERTCDCSFDDFVNREIFEPLGMSSSTFLLADADPDMVAKSYRSDGVTESSFWLMAIRPSGSLLSTAEDLGKLIQFYATRGASAERDIVPKRWLERMENQETSAVARAGMIEGGYGLANFGFFAGEGHIYHGHTGATDGFRTWLGYDPDYQRGFVVMLNGESSSDRSRLRDIVTTYLTRDYPAVSLQKEAFNSELEQTDGWFSPFTHDMPLRSWLWEVWGAVKLGHEDNRLTVTGLRPGSDATKLVPVGNGLYRAPDLPIATAAILLGPDSEPVYINVEAYRQISSIRALGLPVLLLTIAVIAMTSLLFAMYWIPMRLIGRLDIEIRSSVRLWVLLASVSFVALVVLFVEFGILAAFDRVGHLGKISVESLLLMLLSIVGAAASVVAVRRAWCAKNLTSQWGQFVLVVTLTVLAGWLFLATEHWVPLITFLP